MSKFSKALEVASGIYIFKRTKAAFTDFASGVRNIAESVKDKPVQNLDRNGKKFSVWSHAKQKYFYADDFGVALRDAFTESDMKRMVQESGIIRKIQAHGAMIVCIVSVLIAWKLHSFIPLFSIFPATTLFAFAIRRGCWEETLKNKKQVDLKGFFEEPGFMGLFR